MTQKNSPAIVHPEVSLKTEVKRGAPPTVPRPEYVQNDANLQMAKDTLEQWLQDVHQPAPDENMLRDRLPHATWTQFST